MDNNVSKNTNSHKFFKLRLNQETSGISLKTLLKQELLTILNIYQQNFKINLNLDFFEPILERKISLFLSDSLRLGTNKRQAKISAKLKDLLIGYSCPVGLLLASELQLSPAIIIEQLSQLLVFQQDNTNAESTLLLWTKTTSSGWMNFVLDSKLIATWLERSLFLIKHSLKTPSLVADLEQHSTHLFPVQYVHARCYSLLHLGAREKLIVWDKNSQQFSWGSELSARSWTDQEHNLWLTESAEYDLLRQLLMATDSWVEDADDCNWSKIAFDLSQSTAIFLAECRFLGKIKQRQPQKAIARIGLIALVQYWLERMLVEKLKVAAPKEL